MNKNFEQIDWDNLDWDALEGKRQATELRQLRRRTPLSQERMAELCGCSRNTITAMESNVQNTTQKLINRYKAVAVYYAEMELAEDVITATKEAPATIKDTADTMVKRLRRLLEGRK